MKEVFFSKFLSKLVETPGMTVLCIRSFLSLVTDKIPSKQKDSLSASKKHFGPFCTVLGCSGVYMHGLKIDFPKDRFIGKRCYALHLKGTTIHCLLFDLT